MKTVNDETLVSECMTTIPITTSPDVDLTDAVRLMGINRLSAVPVVDDEGKLCGILSTSDLISVTFNLQSDIAVLPHVSDKVRETLLDAIIEDQHSVTVSAAMTTTVVTVTPDTPVSIAAQKLLDTVCHHLPVVNAAGKPIGIISTMDIIETVAGNK